MEGSRFCFELPGYCWQDLLALNRLNVKKSKLYRWLIPLLRVVMCLVGGFAFLIAAMLIYDACHGAKMNWVLLAAFLLLGLLWLYAGLFYYHRRARKSRRLALQDAGGIRIEFSGEDITGNDKKGCASYCYDAFAGAYDYCDRWFLFLDKRHALILPRTAMTEGDPEAFVRFLEKKIGTVVHIKSHRKGAKI